MINKRLSSLIKIFSICAAVAFFSLLCSIQPCFAAFSLSVEPYEGGYDLRFGRVDTQDVKIIKEVTIQVTTNIGKQYRVYQRLDKPLITPDGVEIDRNQFKMYILTNSNTRGTLERIEEFPVMLSDTVLYTSNTAGEGDSFRIVYTLDPSINQVAGSYYGRILFIARPIDSTQDEEVETLQMYADLSNEGSVEVSTDSGFKSIRISSRDLDKDIIQQPSVYISVKGNLGTTYRLYQKLGDSLIKSSSGEQFDLKKVVYEASDANSGAIIKRGDLSELKRKFLVYVSDNLGSSNEITIKYGPSEDFSQQKANLYTGTINYYLELDRASAAIESGFIDSVDVGFDVEPIFRIIATSIFEGGKVATYEGSVLLQFGEIGYKSGVKESKVRIRVESNLGRPYLVTQKLTGTLQNEEGYEIPKELFTFELEKQVDTTGRLKLDAEVVVETDKDVALFVSNGEGDSDEFDIIYKLKVTSDTREGNYNTGLSYSLSEL